MLLITLILVFLLSCSFVFCLSVQSIARTIRFDFLRFVTFDTLLGSVGFLFIQQFFCGGGCFRFTAFFTVLPGAAHCSLLSETPFHLAPASHKNIILVSK